MQGMDYSFVAERIAAIQDKMAAAACRSGRSPEDITLLAVSKFHPLEAVLAAWKAGARQFGESRVQEVQEKYVQLPAQCQGLKLDMIGHLQSNKIAKALPLFDRISSVDSQDLLLALDAKAGALGLPREILLELHTGEASKEGFASQDQLSRAVEAFLSRKQKVLRLGGLMTMAPNTDDEASIRLSFSRLRGAFEALIQRFGKDLGPDFKTLSMGMSSDFELAIEEGSTMVRIGSSIFGERDYAAAAPAGGKP